MSIIVPPSLPPVVVAALAVAVTAAALCDRESSAVEAKVIPKSKRTPQHGLKHRGITGTRGTRADEQQTSGHNPAAMLDTYDHEVPAVKPAGDQ